MPNQTRSKRVALSVPPDVYAVLKDLSELQNKPKSTIITEILEQTLPQLILMRDSLQAVKDGMNPKEAAWNMLISAKQMLNDFEEENK